MRIEERVAMIEARLNEIDEAVADHLRALYARTEKLFEQNQTNIVRLKYFIKAHNKHVLAEHPKKVRSGWPRRAVQANRTWAKRYRNAC